MADPKDVTFGEPGAPLSRRAPYLRGLLWTLGALTAIAIGFGIREAADELELVLIAAFLAVGLHPAVKLAERRGLKRGWAVLIIAVLLFSLIAAVVFVFASALRGQIASFINNAPHLIEDLRHNRTIAHLDARYHILSKLELKLRHADLGDTVADKIFNASSSILSTVIGTLVVFVLTLYFLAALPKITRGIYSLAPASRRERVSRLGEEILRRVGRYTIGALSVALIAGTVTLTFLFIVGLGSYALALAMLVALLDLVPLVGSVIGAGIVCLVGLATSIHVGIACVIFYVIYETIEGYVIYPRVMRSSVDVPEYVSIIAVLVGGAIAGVIGALMALPTAAGLLLLVREVWIRRQDTA